MDILLEWRLGIQGSLVRLQSFVIQGWTVLCLCVWTHDHIQKRHQNRTWNTVELDMIQFVLRSWRSESCTEYWLWCVTLCVGVDRTSDVLTRPSVCECSLPWHVWIDSRTSVKCVWRMLGVFVYYESIKRELKTKPIHEFRYDERLKTKVEESTRLTCTVVVYYESLKRVLKTKPIWISVWWKTTN